MHKLCNFLKVCTILVHRVQPCNIQIIVVQCEITADQFSSAKDKILQLLSPAKFFFTKTGV